MKRRFPKPRTLLILLLLLAGGAIVNVAVAWGCAVFHPDTTYGVNRKPIQGMYQWDGTEATWVVTYMPEAGGARLSADDTARAGGSRLSAILVVSDIPPWSRFKQGPSNFAQHLPCWTEMARGWPCYSMYDRVEEDLQAVPTAGRTIYDAIRVPYGKPECRLSKGDESFLPLRPIWPGFAINTLFYAAMLWLLFAAPFALRRRRRIKRGLCPKCAYPVGESPICTECGKPVTPR